ncbi:hypothetical protein METP3_02573 [Methanosarcinales archaeon]|nr:hypothetical protein METP3_02573 [Methanosarcinales archaeon]
MTTGTECWVSLHRCRSRDINDDSCLLKAGFSGKEIERLDSTVNKQKIYKQIFLRLSEQLFI